jgi:hypothetical protein
MQCQRFDRRLYLAREDGALPTPLSVTKAPGESGVSVLRLRFPGDAYYGATLRQHFIRFQISPQVRLESAPIWGAIRRDVTVGSLAIYPGVPCRLPYVGQFGRTYMFRPPQILRSLTLIPAIAER